MFPQRLESPIAYNIAKAMRDGFDRHYRLFRTESARAKHRFETADWHDQQRDQREGHGHQGHLELSPVTRSFRG